MSIDKKINYKIQGGVKNYKPSEMVTVPKKAKSSPKHPATELAYITKAEKDLLIKKNLHGSLKGKVNKGPGGVMSLNGGINAGAGQRVNPGFFDSRTTISPEEEAAAKAYRQDSNNLFAQKAYNATRGGTLGNFISGGGILGAGIRGLGNMFGLGKTYNEPTYDLSKYSGLGVYNDTFEGVPFKSKGQLGRARTLTNAGILTQQGDYDIYGNKINELTGEVIDPVTGEVITVLPGYPGSDDGGITTINKGDSGNNYTQNLVETINETVDDNIPNEDLLLRYLGADSTLNPDAAGVNTVAELRKLQKERAKNIFTT